MNQKTKTAYLIAHIKKEILNNPNIKASISKKAMKDIVLFVSLYKEIFKELKFMVGLVPFSLLKVKISFNGLNESEVVVSVISDAAATLSHLFT